MLVKSFGEDERRKMTKSDFFGSPFLSSHVLNGTFVSIFMNCYTDCNHAGINILDQLYLSEESRFPSGYSELQLEGTVINFR